jgi:hypothetical protein
MDRYIDRQKERAERDALDPICCCVDDDEESYKKREEKNKRE